MFALLLAQLKAQIKDGFFRNLGVKEGLPSEYILDAIQDKNGFIWVASTNGLSRYDGYGFKNYESDNTDSTSIAGDFIFCMEPDTDETIWLGHYESGLDQFDTRSGKVIRHFNENSKINNIPDNRITKIWNEKEKKRVWIGTSKEHFVWFDKTNNKIITPQLIKHPDQKEALPERNSFYDFKISPSNPNEYYLASNDGLALFNDQTNQIRYFYPQKIKEGYANNNRLRSLIIIDNTIWVASRGGDGLMSFDIPSSKWSFYPFSKIGSQLVVQIIRKSEEELWLATIGNGLISFNLKDKSFSFFDQATQKPSNLASNLVRNLFKDNQNNIWVSTQNGLGVFTPDNQLFPLREIPIINSPDNLSRTPLTFWDNKDFIIVGLSNSPNILRVNKKTNEQAYLSPPKTNSKLYSIRMANRPNGELWISRQSEFWVMNKGLNSVKIIALKEFGLEGKYIQSLLFLDNDRVLLGSRFSGLYLVNLKTNTHVALDKENFGLVHNRFLHEMIQDDQGRVWIGTERGISIVDFKANRVIKNFGLDQGYKVIYRLTKDENGNIWASSEGQGVYGFNANTLVQEFSITKKNGLPSNAIQHLAADLQGSLWISTQQGLCKYSLRDRTIQVFNTSNGLIDNHLEGSLNLLSDGSMALGFKNAYTVFKPEEFNQPKLLTPPVITSFEVFDEQRSFVQNQILTLKPSENFFAIGFSALDYAIADKLEYQFRLIGVDNSWISARKKREAIYTNLESGNYTFEVRYAIKGLGSWSKPATLKVEIEPPFWKTVWFYLVVLSLIAFLVRAFYQLKVDQVKKEERIKTELNKELAALEMKALRSQMNPHFIFNSLNSIKFYVLQNDTKNASKYLNQFSSLIRRIFNNTQQEFTILEEEIETLELFLQMEKLRFGDKLNYNFIIDEELETAFIKVPNMIFQPHIENAVWHGIMHKNEPGKIDITFNMLSEEYFEVLISDNGIGRKASEYLKSKSVTEHKSRGIQLTQNRIELINENHKMDININITDLVDSEGKALGTEVRTKMKLVYV